ncbi:potassium transporter TrkG [Deinococcus maricopensis]|uniref:potassium transporter TrkG n=1 Tax=Deinococcus maricopensis TaxID=309887 RepID=UPI00030B3B0B|nr:potassium transporter TrkG [Deinococcus maricopensis]
MFVGTHPTFIGGIKTTTVFGWRVALVTLQRAVMVLMLALVVVALGSLVLLITDPALPPLPLVFKAVSAFGTAGFSVNSTPRLSPAGLVVVTTLMFLGRVGFLPRLLAFAHRHTARVRHPEKASLMVG